MPTTWRKGYLFCLMYSIHEILCHAGNLLTLLSQEAERETRNQGQRYTISVHNPSDPVHRTNFYLFIHTVSMNSPVDESTQEYSDHLTQSPFKSPASGHMRLWEDILILKYNIYGKSHPLH